MLKSRDSPILVAAVCYFQSPTLRVKLSTIQHLHLEAQNLLSGSCLILFIGTVSLQWILLLLLYHFILSRKFGELKHFLPTPLPRHCKSRWTL